MPPGDERRALLEGFRVDLADSLARDRETPTGLIERELAIESQAVTEKKNLPLPRVQGTHHVLDLLGQLAADGVSATSSLPARVNLSGDSTTVDRQADRATVIMDGTIHALATADPHPHGARALIAGARSTTAPSDGVRRGSCSIMTLRLPP